MRALRVSQRIHPPQPKITGCWPEAHLRGLIMDLLGCEVSLPSLRQILLAANEKSWDARGEYLQEN